jgi:hypothetical protein
MTDEALEALKTAVEIMKGRGDLYTTEPREVAPVESIEGVILYKAHRAFYGNSTTKKIDEYLDIINYSAFAIAKLKKKVAEDVKTQVKKNQT